VFFRSAAQSQLLGGPWERVLGFADGIQRSNGHCSDRQAGLAARSSCVHPLTGHETASRSYRTGFRAILVLLITSMV
jgi:hypothetical protein